MTSSNSIPYMKLLRLIHNASAAAETIRTFARDPSTENTQLQDGATLASVRSVHIITGKIYISTSGTNTIPSTNKSIKKQL